MSRAHDEIPSDLFTLQEKIINTKMEQEVLTEEFNIPVIQKTLIPFCEDHLKNLVSASEKSPIDRFSVERMAKKISSFCQVNSGAMFHGDDIHTTLADLLDGISLSPSNEELNFLMRALIEELRGEVTDQKEYIDKALKPLQGELNILEAQRDRMLESLSKLVTKQDKKLSDYGKHLVEDTREEQRKGLPAADEALKQKNELARKIGNLIDIIKNELKKPSKGSTQEDFNHFKENILALYKEQDNAVNVFPAQREKKGKALAVLGYTSKGASYAEAFNKFLKEFAKLANLQPNLQGLSATVGAGSRQKISEEKIGQQREDSRSMSGLEGSIAKVYQEAIILYKIEDSPKLSKFSIHGGGKQKLRGAETCIYLLDKVSQKMGNEDMNVECLAVVYTLLKNNCDKNLLKYIRPILAQGEGFSRDQTLAAIEDLIKSQLAALGKSFDEYKKDIIVPLAKAIKEGPKPEEYAKKIDAHLDKLLEFTNPWMRDDKEKAKFRNIEL